MARPLPEPRHFTYRQAWIGSIVLGLFWAFLAVCVGIAAWMIASPVMIALAIIMGIATIIYAVGAVHARHRAIQAARAKGRPPESL